MRFKLDWASLIVGSKFTVFASFYFVFEGNFPSASPQGAYITVVQLRTNTAQTEHKKVA